MRHLFDDHLSPASHQRPTLTKRADEVDTMIARLERPLHIAPGDILRFEVEGDRAIVSKVATEDDAYLKGLDATLGEWATDADEDAYRDL